MKTKNISVTIYTIQTPCHDITVPHEPTGEYSQETGAYYEMAQYLKWTYWVWAFEDLKDFDNDYMTIEKLHATGITLWILSVPQEAIKWCALYAHCENRQPLEHWFYSDAKSIRQDGDIPEALIQSPINPAWVVHTMPAREAFSRQWIGNF